MPETETDEENVQNYLKRAKANDPIALCQMGKKCHKRNDDPDALKYFTEAAALGDADSHYNLSIAYQLGEGVEKDPEKELHHLEEAAIGGHPSARYNLGCIEDENGRMNRAIKHFIIAARLGDDGALEV